MSHRMQVLKIEPDQWKDVSRLVLAANAFEKAADELNRVKAKFNIPPTGGLQVDIEAGEIRYMIEVPDDGNP